MKIVETHASAVLGALLLLATPAAISAQEPKYKADIPASVTTPDKLQTELLGDLDFFDGRSAPAVLRQDLEAG